MAIAAAPLIHIYLPKKNPEVVAYSKMLDKKVDIIDQDIEYLRKSYDEGRITAIEFIRANDQLKADREQQIASNDELYDIKVDQSRVFGFKTLRVFLIAFGIRVVYLFLSIAISIIIILLVKPEKGMLKNSLVLFQVFCYSISLYEIIWVFWNAQDYPIITYWWGILLFTTTVSVALVYFLMWYRFKLQRQYQVIMRQFDFMHYDVKDEGFINPMKEKQYDTKTEELVKEAIQDE